MAAEIDSESSVLGRQFLAAAELLSQRTVELQGPFLSLQAEIERVPAILREIEDLKRRMESLKQQVLSAGAAERAIDKRLADAGLPVKHSREETLVHLALVLRRDPGLALSPKEAAETMTAEGYPVTARGLGKGALGRAMRAARELLPDSKYERPSARGRRVNRKPLDRPDEPKERSL
jgi:hypothetical protein